jgi:hypothetical protein
VHETKPLGLDFTGEEIDPRHVAAGPRQACDQPKRHRILADTEHHRDDRRGGFGSERPWSVGRCGDHRDTAPDGIVEDCGKVLVVTVQPVIFDDDVLALRKPALAQAFAKLGGQRRGRVNPSSIDQRDHRHCRLLRARRERPSGKSCNSLQELAPSHRLRPRLGPRQNAITSGIAEQRNEVQRSRCRAAILGRSCVLWVKSGHHRTSE